MEDECGFPLQETKHRISWQFKKTSYK